MFSITWIENGALESIATPSFARAICVADALYYAGYNVRLWKTTAAGKPVLV